MKYGSAYIGFSLRNRKQAHDKTWPLEPPSQHVLQAQDVVVFSLKITPI